MTYDINGVESLINSIPLHDKQSEDVCCVYATSTQFAVVIAYFSSPRSYQVGEQTVYRKINCVFTASHFTLRVLRAGRDTRCPAAIASAFRNSLTIIVAANTANVL